MRNFFKKNKQLTEEQIKYELLIKLQLHNTLCNALSFLNPLNADDDNEERTEFLALSALLSIVPANDMEQLVRSVAKQADKKLNEINQLENLFALPTTTETE